MLSILPPERAERALRAKIEELEKANLLDMDEGIMLGCLIARSSGGQETASYAFSGAWKGKYIVDGFVPPCFSASAFEAIVDRYNSQIHCYSDRIELGEEGLESTRRALSNACLEEIRENYTFFTPAGPVKFADMDLSAIPTGTGDCATAKLISYCFKRKWEPLSLCEIYYGKGNTKHEHMEVCTPCDEKCGLILPHIFRVNLLYSDEAIAVLDKEAGMLSVPGRGEDKADCASARIRAIFPSVPENPSVHRLDMDTSGILVFAKSEEAKRKLSMQFERRETEKTYVALVDGLVKEKEGTIELPLRLDVDNRPYQIVDHEMGKKALTEWKRLGVEIIDGRTVTRIRFFPHTGRTHQIRVHAASGLGHPIVGDRLYGERRPGERLCLHAESLSFTHPLSGERVTFSSVCPF